MDALLDLVGNLTEEIMDAVMLGLLLGILLTWALFHVLARWSGRGR